MHSMERVIYLRYEVKSFLEMEWFILSATMLAQDIKYHSNGKLVIYAGAQKQQNYRFLWVNHIQLQMLITSIVYMFKKKTTTSVWCELKIQPKQNSYQQEINYQQRQSVSVQSCVFCAHLGDLIVWIALVWKHAGVLSTIGFYHMMPVIYSDNLSKSYQAENPPFLANFRCCCCFI